MGFNWAPFAVDMVVQVGGAGGGENGPLYVLELMVAGLEYINTVSAMQFLIPRYQMM